MKIELLLEMIGKNVAGYRKAKPLSQRRCANLVGISYRYFQSIESGKANITMSTLSRLAEFFDVHPRDFFPEKSADK